MSRTLIAILLAVGLVGTATAATPGKAEFAQGTRFFDAGEFEAALPLFRKAYELSGRRPSAVLALAQCLRVLKQYDEALEKYREYVATNPPDKVKITETIRLTEELRLSVPKADDEPSGASPSKTEADSPKADAPPGTVVTRPEVVASPPPPAEASKGSIWASPVFWIVTGAVVAAGGAVAIAFVARPDAEIYGGSSGVIAMPGGS